MPRRSFTSLEENGINTEAISHLRLRSLCLDYVAWKIQFPHISKGFGEGVEQGTTKNSSNSSVSVRGVHVVVV